MDPRFAQNYRIIKKINQGGMSEIFLAEQIRTKKQLVVKSVSKNQGIKLDFLAEADILIHLDHDMLPKIYDIFDETDNVYIVEDYVEGVALDVWLKSQGRAPENVAYYWFTELCRVLQYLHGNQPFPIIYRDMKPSNVMLQPDGRLKLIDFGIAREYKSGNTDDTTYIGTRGYAAPEQFGKSQSDARTDIYSLGITMYHILTGRGPNEEPFCGKPLREMDPSISVGMDYIVARCIRPDKNERYQSVEELLADLSNIHTFDAEYKRYKRNKLLRTLTLTAMFLCSAGLLAGGVVQLGKEKTQKYLTCLEEAEECMEEQPVRAMEYLKEASHIDPKRPEAYGKYAYALYLDGQYDKCIKFALSNLNDFPDDPDLLLALASSYFELENYSEAGDYFYKAAKKTDMKIDNLRDYAVCMGRLGQISQAEKILDQIIEQDDTQDISIYVAGEIYYVQGKYLEAEETFQKVIAQTKSPEMMRRAYIALATTYRDSAKLPGGDPERIGDVYTKSIAAIADALKQEGMQNNTVLLEMQSAAYYGRAIERDYNGEDMITAAAGFMKVVDAGIQKEYLYVNAFTAYQYAGAYEEAKGVLDKYQTAYPSDYVPHALLAQLYIMIENGKPEEQRDFTAAYEEYQKAVGLVDKNSDTTQLQQLEGLINQLKSGGWL